jgi:hypothetical protein
MAIRFLWNNLADAATLTVSSESADFPAVNLKDRRYKIHHRTTGVTSEWWKWNLGEAKDIYAFLFWYHNFQSGATIKIQANFSDLWDAPAFEETLTWSTFKLVKYFSSVKTYQWWRLWVQDAGNPDGYLRGGRPFLGGFFEPSRNFHKDWKRSIVDFSDIEYSSGGQAFANEKDVYYRFDLSFPSILTPDDATFDTIGKTVARKKAFFITINPSDPVNSTYYVHSLSDWELKHVFGGKTYQLDLSLREEL